MPTIVPDGRVFSQATTKIRDEPDVIWELKQLRQFILLPLSPLYPLYSKRRGARGGL